jgi:hypothetical protein
VVGVSEHHRALRCGTPAFTISTFQRERKTRVGFDECTARHIEPYVARKCRRCTPMRCHVAHTCAVQGTTMSKGEAVKVCGNRPLAMQSQWIHSNSQESTNTGQRSTPAHHPKLIARDQIYPHSAMHWPAASKEYIRASDVAACAGCDPAASLKLHARCMCMHPVTVISGEQLKSLSL